MSLNEIQKAIEQIKAYGDSSKNIPTEIKEYFSKIISVIEQQNDLLAQQQPSRGKKYPDLINVIVEIESQSPGVKYEFDKQTGLVCVDRFIATPMYYPCEYGFVPCTQSDDGDPVDVLIISKYQIKSGSMIECRPIGVLNMEDEKGGDEKIIAVPSSSVTKMYDDIKDISDVNSSITDQIKHFFENYKALEKGKWVKIGGFGGVEDAKRILKNSIR
jgi:inorganic pyrophosphatase